MTICGIDPGLTGYISLINSDGSYIEHHKTPVITTTKKTRKRATGRISTSTKTNLDEQGIQSIFVALKACHGDLHVFIEKQHAMSGQGIASTAKTMYGFGIFIGLLVGLSIPYTVVSAKDWQKHMLPEHTEDTKAASIASVKLWLPQVSLLRTARSKVPDHNLSDSLNIALYGRFLQELPVAVLKNTSGR